MKKFLLAGAVLCTLAFLQACNSGSGGDPKATVMSFMEALSKKDFEGAKKYATAESASMLDMIKTQGGAEIETKNEYNPDKVVIGDAKIEGDAATVPIKVKENDMTVNYSLKKENGSWKVAFDKASLAKMGMDAMQQNSGKLLQNDTLRKAMDEMKNIPMDSLQKMMEQMKNLPTDSISKAAMKDAMKELKKLNMDSLKQAMQQGMNALDTLKRP